MIDICVTHFGDKYNTKYLDNLQNGIARNYSGDFNFLVETNCPNNHWDKISFFECDKPRIIMDIDFIITSNLDELIDYEIPEDSLAAFPPWWRYNGCKINGGFYKINPGENINLLPIKFYSDPNLWLSFWGKAVGTPGKGEQNFVEQSVKNITMLPGQWMGVYTDGCFHNGETQTIKKISDKYFKEYGLSLVDGEAFGNDIKLVHFIYDDNQIENRPQWIQDLWNTT